jgi:putative FmdB family regulatory protein
VPVYEYYCESCEEITERERTVADRKKRAKCSSCGSTRTTLIISKNSFHLKGGGWYMSDYAGKK